MGENWKNFEEHVRECLNCLEEFIERNLDVKDAVSEGSEGSGEFLLKTGVREILSLEWQNTYCSFASHSYAENRTCKW